MPSLSLKLTVKKLSADDETVLVNLKCAYYIGKHELPKEELMHQVDLMNFVFDKPVTDNKQYTNNRSVSEFKEVISDVILEDKTVQIKIWLILTSS